MAEATLKPAVAAGEVGFRPDQRERPPVFKQIHNLMKRKASDRRKPTWSPVAPVRGTGGSRSTADGTCADEGILESGRVSSLPVHKRVNPMAGLPRRRTGRRQVCDT